MTTTFGKGASPEEFDAVIQLQQDCLTTERPRILAHVRRILVTVDEQARGATPAAAATLADTDAMITDQTAKGFAEAERRFTEAGSTVEEREAGMRQLRHTFSELRERTLSDLRSRSRNAS